MLRYCVVLLLFGRVALASDWRPSEELLTAIRFVESSNGTLVYGDGGHSLGDFQLSEAAWVDVNAWRKAQRLPCYAYSRHVLDRRLNRVYAADYISILYGALTKKLSRTPTHAELYAAYNMGLSQFAQCKYRLSQVNKVTRRKCEQIARIMELKGSPEVRANATRVSSRT